MSNKVTHYNTMSRVGFSTMPFNQFHKSEIQNTVPDYDEQNIRVSLSRIDALELVNKWNRMTGKNGTKYTINAEGS